MTREKKIAIILPRGETIRNFVYSDIVKALKDKFEVTLFAVKPNEEILVKN
ncbi:MAG: hypothetical protein H6604_01060 [Flavobacteriales bacterium]|nr:hypothetical protein [Flavobacteriales bacterium]